MPQITRQAPAQIPNIRRAENTARKKPTVQGESAPADGDPESSVGGEASVTRAQKQAIAQAAPNESSAKFVLARCISANHADSQTHPNFVSSIGFEAQSNFLFAFHETCRHWVLDIEK